MNTLKSYDITIVVYELDIDGGVTHFTHLYGRDHTLEDAQTFVQNMCECPITVIDLILS